MTVVEYKMVSQKVAWEGNYPDTWEPDDYDDINHIYRFEDGVPVEMLACDGGEPEDNTFYRDGRWIVPALNAAYELGLKANG